MRLPGQKSGAELRLPPFGEDSHFLVIDLVLEGTNHTGPSKDIQRGMKLQSCTAEIWQKSLF